MNKLSLNSNDLKNYLKSKYAYLNNWKYIYISNERKGIVENTILEMCNRIGIENLSISDLEDICGFLNSYEI